MARHIVYSDEVRRRVAAGVNTLADAVKVTLGPRGRHVLLEKPWGAPTVTKDGVTVAKEIDVANRFENMAVQMVKEVAEKTAAAAGDGTTTATVLAQIIFSQGARLVAAGHDPLSLKRGIDAAVDAVVAALKKLARPTQESKEIAQVATISANGEEEIGKLIAAAMDKVGKKGVIQIEENRTVDTVLDLVEGMQWDRGYLSPLFITDVERLKVELEDCLVLVHEKKLSTFIDLLPMMEKVAQQGKPLLIVADDVDGDAIALMCLNKVRGILPCCAVKPPGFGDRRKEMLRDIAIMTGGKAIMEDMGLKLESVPIDHLGRAKRVIVDKESCTIIGGGGNPAEIKGRIKLIEKEIEQTNSEYDKDKLNERLAKLAGGVAILKVGGTTEAEVRERRARVEDALAATRAAIEEGIVAGGGVALVQGGEATDEVVFEDDRRYGVQIVKRALEEPLRQIAWNGGADPVVVLDRVRKGEGSFGFNAATEQYEDLIAAGVIDPAKVVRIALQNAASVAALMLTAESLIGMLPQPPKPDEPAEPAPAEPHDDHDDHDDH
jgi:chaperonin GroEL